MPVLTAIRPITPGPPTKPISPLTTTSPLKKHISPLKDASPITAEPPPSEPPSVPPSTCSIINKYLKEHQISDDDLVGLSVRELNSRLTELPEGLRREYKSRRRTLKNRGYAQNCRLKRASTSKEMRLMNKLLTSKLQISTSKFVTLMQNFDFLLKDFHELQMENERLIAGGQPPANLVSESDFISEMHLRLEKQWSAEVEQHNAISVQIKAEIETCRKEKNEFQWRLMQQEQDQGCFDEDLNQELLAEQIASSTKRLNRLLNASDPPSDSTGLVPKETHEKPQQKTLSEPFPLDLAFRSHPLPD
ncbi:UNVERIFIED_CONTAM: hypothetical protein GTU68_008058 [Idotea baltica]|nr:hypothetical protein [Idotea baltica]